MGLARLDIYERYTIGSNFMFTYLGIPRPSAVILYFKKASLGGNRSGNRQNFGIPRTRRFQTFLGGDFRRFPRDVIEFVGKTGSDAEKK